MGVIVSEEEDNETRNYPQNAHDSRNHTRDIGCAARKEIQHQKADDQEEPQCDLALLGFAKPGET